MFLAMVVLLAHMVVDSMIPAPDSPKVLDSVLLVRALCVCKHDRYGRLFWQRCDGSAQQQICWRRCMPVWHQDLVFYW